MPWRVDTARPQRGLTRAPQFEITDLQSRTGSSHGVGLNELLGLKPTLSTSVGHERNQMRVGLS